MEGTPGSSKRNEVDSQHNQHQCFFTTQTRFQSALKKFKSDIKMFNDFRDLLVVSFPTLRRQISKTTSIVRSCSAPSILLSSEQLYVSSVPETPSWQKVNKDHNRNVKINESRDVETLYSVQRSRSNYHDGCLRNDNSVQDSDLETLSKGRASPGVHGSPRPANEDQDKLWNVSNAVRKEGTKILDRINVDRNEKKCIVKEEENEVTKLKRENEEYLNRIEKLEEDATRSHKLVLMLRKQFEDLTKIRNELQEHLLDEAASRFRKHEFASDLIEFLPAAGNDTGLPCGSTTVAAIVSEIIDKMKFHNNTTDKTVAIQVDPADLELGPNDTSFKIQRGRLGALDDALAFPKEVIKVEDIDTAKILVILGERSHVVLQRHLIIATIRNQINTKKLDQIQTNYNYLMTRFEQLSLMNGNLCKELTDQLKELHSARLRIMELMQLVPLAELQVEMQNKEKNTKSIPMIMSTSLPDRRDISQSVTVPGLYSCQARPGTRGSSKLMSRYTRHSVETERHKTRSGSPISTGPSHYKSDNPDPTATGTAPNETSTRRKLFSWSTFLK